MSQSLVFTPKYNTAITVAPTTSSASTTYGQGSNQFVVTNTGSVNCYVSPADTASDKDYLVLPNTQVTITKSKQSDIISYISASGTGELHIIVGDGF